MKREITCIVCPRGCRMTADIQGETVTVTAAPAEGYELEAIYVDGVAIEGSTYTVRGLHTVTATFRAAEVVPAVYAITVGAVTGGTVAVDKAEAEAGETVVVTATPASGYALEAIYVDGAAIEGNAFVVTGGHTVTATFYKLLTFAGASVSMAEALDVNIMISKANVDKAITDGYIEMVGPDATGATRTVRVDRADWVVNGTYYKVTYSGLAAKQMAEDIIVTVYDANGKQISENYVSGIRAYAMRGLANARADAETKTLLVDMLNYGAAAQNKFNYMTDDLANALLTDDQKALGTNVTKAYQDNCQKILNMAGSNFALESRIEMNMYFNKITVGEGTYALVKLTHHNEDTETVVRIEGSEFKKSGSMYIVNITEIVTADGRELVTCEVYDANDTLIAKGIDSLESYVARAIGQKPAENMWMEELLDFSDAAYTYLH